MAPVSFVRRHLQRDISSSKNRAIKSKSSPNVRKPSLATTPFREPRRPRSAPMTSVFLGPRCNGNPPVDSPQHCTARRPKLATHAPRTLLASSSTDVKSELMMALSKPAIRVEVEPTETTTAETTCQAICRKNDPCMDYPNIMPRRPTPAKSCRPSTLISKDLILPPHAFSGRLKKLPTVRRIYDTCGQPPVNTPNQSEAKPLMVSEAQAIDANNRSGGQRPDGYPGGTTQPTASTSQLPLQRSISFLVPRSAADPKDPFSAVIHGDSGSLRQASRVNTDQACAYVTFLGLAFLGISVLSFWASYAIDELGFAAEISAAKENAGGDGATFLTVAPQSDATVSTNKAYRNVGSLNSRLRLLAPKRAREFHPTTSADGKTSFQDAEAPGLK